MKTFSFISQSEIAEAQILALQKKGFHCNAEKRNLCLLVKQLLRLWKKISEKTEHKIVKTEHKTSYLATVFIISKTLPRKYIFQATIKESFHGEILDDTW